MEPLHIRTRFNRTHLHGWAHQYERGCLLRVLFLCRPVHIMLWFQDASFRGVLFCCLCVYIVVCELICNSMQVQQLKLHGNIIVRDLANIATSQSTYASCVGCGQGVLYFSNPNETNARTHMTLKTSVDSGASWSTGTYTHAM